MIDITARIEAIQNGVKSYDPLEHALAGCIIAIDQNGAQHVGRGYVKPEDTQELVRLCKGESTAKDREEDEDDVPASLAAEAGQHKPPRRGTCCPPVPKQ